MPAIAGSFQVRCRPIRTYLADALITFSESPTIRPGWANQISGQSMIHQLARCWSPVTGDGFALGFLLAIPVAPL